MAHNESPHIMIVDDAPETLQMLTDSLDYHGYRVKSFSSGEKALGSLIHEVPDLILLDVKMPFMDGYEVCSRIKSAEKTGKIPVIFISGQDDSADKVKGLNAGGVDYITKPFQMAEVIARIETHLSLSRLQQQLEEQNVRLQKEISEREQIEKELLKHRTLLEQMVAKRTADLRKSNRVLQRENNERKLLEEAFEKANYKLHSLVYEYGLRNRRMSLFNKMLEQLQACLTLEETFPIINYFAKKLFPETAGAIFILDEQGNVLKAATKWETTLAGENEFPVEDCISLQEKKMHLAVVPRKEFCCRHLSIVEGRSSLCIPMLAQGGALGILHLQQKPSAKSMRDKPKPEESSEGISTDMQQLAIAVADIFALALVNIKLRETLKLQALRDPLTNLFNRRSMEDALSRETRRAERQGTVLGIIMLDLDHFRRFNNNFGHEAGDLVLQEMGKFLQRNIREEDIACRFGGEEFTLILPGASLEITQKRADKLQRNVQNLQIHYNGKKLDSLTLSLGVAVYPEHGQTGEAVLQAADKALYRAKRAGRNQTKLASKKTAPRK